MHTLRTDLVVSTLVNLADLEWDSFRQLEAVYDDLIIDTTDPHGVLAVLRTALPGVVRHRLTAIVDDLLDYNSSSVQALLASLETRAYEKRCYRSLRREAEAKDGSAMTQFKKDVLNKDRWFLLVAILDPAL